MKRKIMVEMTEKEYEEFKNANTSKVPLMVTVAEENDDESFSLTLHRISRDWLRARNLCGKVIEIKILE